MTEEQKKSIDNLKQIVKYFERNIENNSLFKPESETSKKIVELIEVSENLTNSQFNEIVEILNTIKLTPHYNGSGWMDFQFRLNDYFRAFGFEQQI